MHDQLPAQVNTKLSAFAVGKSCAFTIITLAWSLIVTPSPAGAQEVFTDNFDGGSLSGWESRNVVQPLGGFVSDTFPANGSGLAFRLQRGSAEMSAIGQPQAYGTGRAWLFRTNIYNDFYVAMDVVNWNNATNQALVLLARASGYDDVLAPGFPPGLGTVNGYVCNYDNAQDGDGPGDRLGGQFQINNITAEGPDTIAAANVTLKQGHTYRFVFNGVGPRLTGRIYDFEDLTQPIVTIVAEDSIYPSGVSGIVSFHRNDSVHPNLTDMTVDNYYAGPTDPNVSTAPALPHSLAGTPQVVTRNPTNRFSSFQLPSQGISFAVATFTTNQIDAAATKLYLNGADFSASLAPLPANGPNASFSTAPGTLTSNEVYSARIEVQDTGGALKSTNTFWFDTFSDNYLTNLLVVEAEDYNFEGGKFQGEAIPVSGVDTNGNPVGGGGVGYVDLLGTPDVDYHDARTSPESGWIDYRAGDFVSTLQGNREEIEDLFHAQPSTPAHLDPARPNDATRSKYAVVGLKEYQVARTEVGEWLNYTRVFTETNYHVYLRVGSFGAQDVQLDLVGGDLTSTNQTTSLLGTFSIPNQLMRANYNYVQLMDGNSPAEVHLGGTNTVRLTVGGAPIKDNQLLYLNYLVFVPTPTRVESTVFDTFGDGNDSAPPATWSHYDPIGTGSWSFPDGNKYRIQSAPSPDPSTLAQGRAGSLLPSSYSDFYVSVDVAGWDPSIHQVVGILARVSNAGPGSTSGYLFSHDSGDPSSPTAGDMDIVRLDGEVPTVLENLSGEDAIHFETNKQYRLVFMGIGTNLIGKVYELPNTSTPVVHLTAGDDAFSSGAVGLMVANNAASSGYDGPADTTFDNFLVTTVEPLLSIDSSQGVVTISWPDIPFVLQQTSSLSTPIWVPVTTGIVQEGNRNVYRVSAPAGSQYYRLVYP